MDSTIGILSTERGFFRCWEFNFWSGCRLAPPKKGRHFLRWAVLQWCAIEFLHLLHMPYWNEVTLNRDKICYNCCKILEQKLCQQRRFRSFWRGTVGLCRSKGIRSTGCQSWRSKKILPISQVRTHFTCAGPIGRIFCWPQTLTACSSAALWSTETHSTSSERSKPPLLTHSLSKSLAPL